MASKARLFFPNELKSGFISQLPKNQSHYVKNVMRLQVGDEIEWFGLESPDGSIHLEKIRLKKGVRNQSRPICECGTRFKVV